MTVFAKSLRLEFYKIRNQGFWLIWAVMTAMPTVWILYSNRLIPDSGRVFFQTEQTYYFAVQDQALSILSIFLPVMASVLISRLCDEEHKGDTWKLLRTSGQDIRSLWNAKFLIVYVCMEIAVFLTVGSALLQSYLQLGTAFTAGAFALNFLGISGANLITLTLAMILSMRFKNQLIVLVEGLAGGLIGVLSSLMPTGFVWFLPWGCYTLNFMAGMTMLGTGPDGNQWMYMPVDPNYAGILLVSLGFLALGLYFRRRTASMEL